MRSDQVAVATTCVVATAIAAAIIAPRIDGTRPWFNYEAFAEKLEPNKAEAFSWTHSYGPMTWSRDGRELLRIKAPSASYWKATNLDEFDGVRWREGPPSRDALVDAPRNGRWIQTIKVVDRGLRSTQFIGAGKVEDILPGSSRLALPQSDGTFVTSSKPLRPGDSYQAQVYVPHPSDSQLRRAGTRYPSYTQDFLEVRVPLRGAVRRPRRPGHRAAAGHQRRHPLQHLRQLPPGRASCGRAASASSRTATASWPTRPTPSCTP